MLSGEALKKLTGEQLAQGMQVAPDNPLVGTRDRAALLRRLGESLSTLPVIFGPEGRPGNLVGTDLREYELH